MTKSPKKPLKPKPSPSRQKKPPSSPRKTQRESGSDCSPWFHNGTIYDEAESRYEAFVYLITNLHDGRQYIGKKVFWTLRKPRKGGRRVREESNWKDYFGSCVPLRNDVRVFGKAMFRREILRLCRTRGESSFFEMKEQFSRGVLQVPGFYNEAIGKWRTYYAANCTVLTCVTSPKVTTSE